MNLTKKKLTLGLITIAILSLLTVLFLMNFHRLNALYPSVTSNYYKLNEPIEFEDLTATITDFELISTKDLCQRLDLTDDEINQFGLKTNTQDMKILVAMDISHSTHKSFIKLCESLTIQSGIYSNGYNLPLAKKINSEVDPNAADFKYIFPMAVTDTLINNKYGELTSRQFQINFFKYPLKKIVVLEK